MLRAGAVLKSGVHHLAFHDQAGSMKLARWVFVMAGLAIAAADGNADDLTALNALKGAISNFAELAAQGWVTQWEGSDPCSASNGLPWTGVQCIDGRVAILMLSSFGQDVRGTLPAELDRLTALQQISIVGEGFTGSLPDTWGAEGGFAELQQIDISQNQLSSTLPAAWGAPDRFQKLQALTLSQNALSGSLPNEWGKAGAFPNIRSLTLSGNKISGSLPEWSEMPALETVDVSQNEAMEGEVPSSWANLNLKSLCTAASKIAGGAKIPGCTSPGSSEVTSSVSTATDTETQNEVQSEMSDDKAETIDDELAASVPPDDTLADDESSSGGLLGSLSSAISTWWVWLLAIALAVAAAMTLAKRRNVYVLLNRGGSDAGLPRLAKGKDHKEAELY